MWRIKIVISPFVGHTDFYIISAIRLFVMLEDFNAYSGHNQWSKAQIVVTYL